MKRVLSEDFQVPSTLSDPETYGGLEGIMFGQRGSKPRIRLRVYTNGRQSNKNTTLLAQCLPIYLDRPVKSTGPNNQSKHGPNSKTSMYVYV